MPVRDNGFIRTVYTTAHAIDETREEHGHWDDGLCARSSHTVERSLTPRLQGARPLTQTCVAGRCAAGGRDGERGT